MKDEEFSKAENRQLRELSGVAHEAEAREMIGRLDASFTEWRERRIDSFDLLELIHRFHQDDARDLWSTHQYMTPATCVARALVHGWLSPETIPEALRERIDRRVALQRELEGMWEARRGDP